MSRTPLVGSCIAISLLLAACGEDDEHTFATLPECVEDHINLGEPEAITHCLIDFFDMNFTDQAACVAYVEAHGGYEESREAACMDYFEERG